MLLSHTLSLAEALYRSHSIPRRARPFQARERERRERVLQENPGLRGIGPLDPEGRGSPHLGGHKAFRIRRGDGEDDEEEDDEDEDEDSEEAGVMPTPTGTSYGFTRSGRRAAVRSTPSGRGTPVPAVLFSPQTPVRAHPIGGVLHTCSLYVPVS